MPFIADRVLDQGLSSLQTEGTRLDLCSSEPTTYTQATSTASLANKTAIGIGAPAARVPSGRRVTVPAQTNGSVTGTGSATHWAITDPANSRLLATGALSASQSLTTGNTFSSTAFDIGIPGAA